MLGTENHFPLEAIWCASVRFLSQVHRGSPSESGGGASRPTFKEAVRVDLLLGDSPHLTLTAPWGEGHKVASLHKGVCVSEFK